MRGCSYYRKYVFDPGCVFPAGAGVFPSLSIDTTAISRVPRRCVGVPTGIVMMLAVSTCSPQVRGCSLAKPATGLLETVFPAGAGVFPMATRARELQECVPRRCGGVPHLVLGLGSTQIVFPAGAGVFLSHSASCMAPSCVPRRCGGVPSPHHCFRRSSECSPQVRGCSSELRKHAFCSIVFPAGAGVFQWRDPGTGFYLLCSPQVRGCSRFFGKTLLDQRVFPAGAGVFPLRELLTFPAKSVPRRCGGVPRIIPASPCIILCSPQVQGCSSSSHCIK